MAFGRNLIYVVFLVLLLGTLILSHADRAIAENYAALPPSADLTTPLKSTNCFSPKGASRAGLSGQTLPDLIVSAYLVIVMMSSLPGVSIWMPDIQWHSQS